MKKEDLPTKNSGVLEGAGDVFPVCLQLHLFLALPPAFGEWSTSISADLQPEKASALLIE